MKKFLILLLVLVLILGGLAAFVSFNSLTLSTGRCLVADDGSYLLVKENYGPIVVSTQENAWMFDGLSTGDEILVAHGPVMETYPGRSGAFFILRLGNGSSANIPADVLSELRELGWIS